MKKNLLKIQVTLVFLFSMLVAQTFAINYYVDPSSTSTTANGSLASPWKTIAQVNSGTTALNPGDTVFFKRGQTYSGRLTVSRSGAAGKPIVYTNYGTGNLPEFNNAVSDIITLSNRQYVVIDGIKIIDNSISVTDHTVQAKISYAINLYNSPNCTISNCDISLVGVGISVESGSDNTTITGNYMHNMRMVRNTPTSVNPDDDYGANPMVVGSSNNTITNNRFEECWALSYDYGYDGGAVELFGTAMNNNKIMYNTAINCNGFMEIGSSSNGQALNNIIAYNKIINCGIIGVYQNGSTFTVAVNNLQYYNNTVVETKKQYSQSNVMFWMAGTGSAGLVVVKNNIFYLSSGVNLGSSKFNSGQMVHSNNIYRMSSGALGITQNATELLSTNANLFTAASGDPATWNYNLPSGSAAINFGTGVGLTRDFAGNAIVGNPDAGMLESGTTVVVPPPVIPPIVATAAAGLISCNGGSTLVTVSATGGTSPYTGIGSFNVVAGSYNYIVTDAKGLKDTASVVVAQPTAIVATVTSGVISVYGGTTSLTANASGGTSPYTFSLNNAAYQSSNIFAGVLAGTYSVNVKDSKGCIVLKSIVVTQPAQVITPVIPPVVATATAGLISCNGGSTLVTVSATGGTSPYTGIGSFSVVAGTYNYIVTDAKGLKDTASIVVAQPSIVVASVSSGVISAYGGTTSLTASASGGTSPYTYSLNNGAYQSSNIFAGVLAGTYSVNVKDSKGCIVLKSIVVTQPVQVITPVIPPIVATAAAGLISCNGGSTLVTVSATGGTSPYTGIGSFNVVAGSYNYIVTDAKGLKDTASVVVAQPTAIVATVTSGVISVYGGTTSLTANASGGTSPYTFSLNNAAYQSSNIFAGVLAGTYSVNVKDSKGCIVLKSIVVTQPAQVITPVIPPIVATATAGAISCNGGSTLVTVTATGGTSPYTGIGSFSIVAGTYNYIVTDAKGLKDTASVVVAQPTAIVATVTSGVISVYGGTTSLTANASGGTSPYTFNLNNAAYQSSNIFAGVLAGTYNVNVKDSKGCIVLKTYVVADYQVSLESNVRFKVNLYPNPTTNYFKLRIYQHHNDYPIQVDVFNSCGRLVYSVKGNSYGQFTFGNDFPRGTYFVKVNVAGNVKTVKAIKL